MHAERFQWNWCTKAWPDGLGPSVQVSYEGSSRGHFDKIRAYDVLLQRVPKMKKG